MQKFGILISGTRRALEEGYQEIVFNGGTAPLTITLHPGEGIFVKDGDAPVESIAAFSVTPANPRLFAKAQYGAEEYE